MILMKNYHRNNPSILTQSCWILWKEKKLTANFQIFKSWLYIKSSFWSVNAGWKVQQPDDSDTCCKTTAVQNRWESFVSFKFLPVDFTLDYTKFVQVRSFASWPFHLFSSFLFLHFWDCYTKMSPTLFHCKLSACVFTVSLDSHHQPYIW